jgi:hypothetical protein
MLVRTVEEDLAIIARAVEAVNRREDGPEIELPAALKEICHFVEKKLGMPPVDVYLLGAKTSALADRCHRTSDRTQRSYRKIRRLDDRVDVAGRLFHYSCARFGFRKAQPAGNCAQHLFLTLAIHRRLSSTGSHGTFYNISDLFR